MRNLPEPSRASDRSDLAKAIRCYKYAGEIKGHDITKAEIDAILAIYDKYEEKCGVPSDELKGEFLPESLRNTMHDAFEKTYKDRHLYSMRELLFKGVELCPVCGIDPATELDHHLPKSAFKPLAIHTRNLVPMCHHCNHIKLAGFDVEGTGFLHPYYDVLPDLDFLHASVELNMGLLKVSFFIDASVPLPNGYCGRLTNQMQKLKLEERYQQEVNNYISSHAAALHLAYRGMRQRGVRMILRLQTNFEINAFHRNHWRPALLRALTDHNDFTAGGFADVLPISEDMLNDLDR